MTFREKSAWVTLAGIAVSSVVYVVIVGAETLGSPVATIDLGWAAFWSVVALVGTIAAGHIWIAARNPGDTGRVAGRQQDRARVILSAGAVLAVALILGGSDPFWVVNVLVGALVGSEIAIAASQISGVHKGEHT